MLRVAGSYFRRNVLQSNVLVQSTGQHLVPSPSNEGIVLPVFTQVRSNRVSSGVTRKKRHKKIIKLAKVRTRTYVYICVEPFKFTMYSHIH